MKYVMIFSSVMDFCNVRKRRKMHTIITISYSQYDDTLQGGKYPKLEKATRQRWSRLLSQREEIVLRLIKLEEGSLPLFLLGTGLSER